MPKKQQHPVSIETINNSVVFHTSSNGEAKHIADLLTRLITTMPSNLCLEDIVDMFQQKRGKILLRKYKDPLTVC
ncbi:MAG: hypothetical protein PXY39_03160, partial [archaeon]|nr:hypothetical protein [archaeon]